jgi:CRP-like cAMP-binding protein
MTTSPRLFGHGTIRSRLLLLLPDDLRDRIVGQCDRVEFDSEQVVYTAGKPVERVYFINNGLVSLTKAMHDGCSVGIGAVGVEGLVGLFSSYGLDQAFVDYVVQVPVVALGMSRKILHDEMSVRHELRGLMRRYLVLVFQQLTQSSCCNRLHDVEERCCHWLLVAADNALSNELQWSRNSLGLLLGMQPQTLAMTANALEQRGMIRISSGGIRILDRAALEETACECYRARCKQIAQALGGNHLAGGARFSLTRS